MKQSACRIAGVVAFAVVAASPVYAQFEIVGSDIPTTAMASTSSNASQSAEQRAMYAAAPLTPGILDFERVR